MSLLAGEGEGGFASDGVSGGGRGGTTEGAVCGGGPGAYHVAVVVARRDSVAGVLSDADGTATGRDLLGAVGSIIEGDARDMLVKGHGNVDSA